MEFTKYYKIIDCGKDRKMLLNTLNSALLELEDKYADGIREGSWQSFDADAVNCLIENGFIYKTDAQRQRALDGMLKVRDNFLSIVFITTQDCNFRCVYCYESHRARAIGQEVYDGVLNFLKKQKRRDVNISWFGGEPTLEKQSVLSFMERAEQVCKQNKCRLTGAMTCNGYLLDAESFAQYVKSGISTYQITLDGSREEHDSLRPLKEGGGSYDAIVKNLREIKKSDLKFTVMIRCNYTENTDLERFVDRLYGEIKDDSRFAVLLYPIGDWSSEEGASGVKTAGNPTLKGATLLMKRHGMTNVRLEISDRPMAFCCGAVHPDSMVVNPDGEIMKCTLKLDADSNKIGKIFPDGTIEYNSNRKLWVRDLPQKCYDCPVMPLCFNQHCPNNTLGCKRAEIENQLTEHYQLKYGGAEAQ